MSVDEDTEVLDLAGEVVHGLLTLWPSAHGGRVKHAVQGETKEGKISTLAARSPCPPYSDEAILMYSPGIPLGDRWLGGGACGMDDGAPLLEELPVRLHAVGQRVVLVVQELDTAISRGDSRPSSARVLSFF